ncbi:hypothetical protein ACOMHN_035178 [Nucella lapillus]
MYQYGGCSANHNENVLCPETHYQCPNDGYCLPVFTRCNGYYDCPHREDELDCDSYQCPDEDELWIVLRINDITNDYKLHLNITTGRPPVNGTELERTLLFSNLGFIQSPGYNPESGMIYPENILSNLTLIPPEDHDIMVSFVHMDLTCKEDLEDMNPTNVLLVDRSQKNQNVFANLSLVTSSSRPQKAAGGLWNCSVPHWSQFQPHFACNLKQECSSGQDEDPCVHQPCGQGGFLVEGRCYMLGHPDRQVTYYDVKVECSRRGGYLVSFNTDAEMEKLLEVLWARSRRFDFYLGLTLADADAPFITKHAEFLRSYDDSDGKCSTSLGILLRT